MALRRHYELHLDSHGEAITNRTLPFVRLNVLSHQRCVGRPVIVANTTGLPGQFKENRIAAARLFPGYDVAFLSFQDGLGAHILFWFGTVTEAGDAVERRTPGDTLIAVVWYMLRRNLIPATLPQIPLSGCERLARRTVFGVAVYRNLRVVTIPEGGAAEDSKIVTVREPGWTCGCASYFDVYAFARALGIRSGDLGHYEGDKSLLFAEGDADCDIPEYVVVPVQSVAALHRVVLDVAMLRAVLADLDGGFASYMYIFTPLPKENPLDVNTYHAKLFNLATLEEEYPTGIEATLIVRYWRVCEREFPKATKWTVYHPGSVCSGRRACIVNVFPTVRGDASHFGGAAVTTGEGKIELKFSNLNERKSVDSGIGTEMEVDDGREVVELSSYLTSEHDGLHELDCLDYEDEWEMASQTDLEALDALLAPY
jgi:hypothetical protein